MGVMGSWDIQAQFEWDIDSIRFDSIQFDSIRFDSIRSIGDHDDDHNDVDDDILIVISLLLLLLVFSYWSSLTKCSLNEGDRPFILVDIYTYFILYLSFGIVPYLLCWLWWWPNFVWILMLLTSMIKKKITVTLVALSTILFTTVSF